MRWPTPFDRYSDPARNKALVAALIISAFLLMAMRMLDGPLRTPVAPRGIVSFELAKNVDASRQILNSWNGQAKKHAAGSLGLDYLFLIVYAAFLSLACTQVSKALVKRRLLLANAGAILAWTQFLAAICDAVENSVLFALLLNSKQLWLPAVARTCAIIKFTIVGAGLIYIASGIIMIGIDKIARKK